MLMIVLTFNFAILFFWQKFFCVALTFSSVLWNTSKLLESSKMDRLLSCPFCRNQYVTLQAYNDHAQAEHCKITRHKCPKSGCRKEFFFTFDLHLHELTTHSGSSEPVEFSDRNFNPSCSSGGIQVSSLQTDEASEKPDRPWSLNI